MKRNLSNRLLLYFLTVIILSLSAVGIVSYVQSSRALERQSEKYMSQVITSASYQTDLYLQNVEKASESILSHISVKRLLDMDPSDSYAYFSYTDELQKNLYRSMFILYPQIRSFAVLPKHGKPVMDDTSLRGIPSGFDAAERYRYWSGATPPDGRITWSTANIMGQDEPSVITLARKIRGLTSYEPNGVLLMEIRAQDLEKIWQPLDLGEDGFFFILDENGRTVYRQDRSGRAEEFSEALLEQIHSHPNDSVIGRLDGASRMFVSRHSDYSKWSLVISVPVAELRKPVSTIRTTAISVGLLTLCGALLLALQFGRSITMPIKLLKDGMREMEKGNWHHLPPLNRQDELGGLIHSYNLMVTRLSEMIQRVYEAELESSRAALELQETLLERHKAEFQALQLQINPHFLYNTLETIKCYAVVQDSDEITEMVEAMAFMLRYSIQVNIEEIRVANELRHVLSYMTIQKHRIGRPFELEVVIPPALLLEKMVRLTLQPVIENVFQHAFPNGIEEGHYIRIDALVKEELFFVIVEDNGAGMLPARLAMLREKLKLNQLAEPSTEFESDLESIYHRGGIGLMNVHRRIQMVFGEAYGLRVESEPGKGTRMIMEMPYQPKKAGSKPQSDVNVPKLYET
jgi:two-component system, sensor histidine kinase YesM